jgi:IMP dehydrogenase/GMP reductase
MDTVTGYSMARFMASNGGVGVVHRYCTIDTQVEIVKTLADEGFYVGAAVGVNGDSWERALSLIEAGASLITIDVAHGHTEAALDRTDNLVGLGHDVIVMSGNICTYEAACDYIEAGAHVLRVGIGGGSSCTTRKVAGVGVPQITAIMDAARARDHLDSQVVIVADGGIRTSGDAVKAIAAGADAVMLGGVLAPYPVSAGPVMLVNTGEKSNLSSVVRSMVAPGKGTDAGELLQKGVAEIDFGERIVKKKVFRGMASDSALKDKGEVDYAVEGEEFLLDIDYDFEKTFADFVKGIRLGLAYMGCGSIDDVHETDRLIEVTYNGAVEALPHMMFRGDKA